jgi:hypothetical protein
MKIQGFAATVIALVLALAANAHASGATSVAVTDKSFVCETSHGCERRVAQTAPRNFTSEGASGPELT